MGVVGQLASRLIGRERQLKAKGWTFGAVAVVAATGSSIYAYSFVHRYLLAALLRRTPKKRLRELKPGDYVRLEGKVTTSHPDKTPAEARVTPARTDTLLSPTERVPCVMFVCVQYRVLEEKGTITTDLGAGRAGQAGRKAVGWLTGGRIAYSKDNWSNKQEVVTEVRRSLPCFVVDDDDDGAWVRLDLGGEPLYLELETVYDKFTPVERQVEVNSSRRTVGYRDIEKVLRLEGRVLVFGEVQPSDPHAAAEEAKELKVGRPATRHMFDQKTSRTKPWVVTTMKQDELLETVERRARVDVHSAVSLALLAISTAYIASNAFNDLARLQLRTR